MTTMLMIDNPAIPLAFIAGPAILANACAILQNGASMRYNLAVTQWREFLAHLSADDDHLSRIFLRPDEAIRLARLRIFLQLRAIELMLSATSVFALTSLLALATALLAEMGSSLTAGATLIMTISGAIGFLLLFATTFVFFRESACSRSLLRLHPNIG